MPLSATVIAGDRSVTSILLVLALFSQCVEFHGFGLHTVVRYAVEILSPRIRVLHALTLLVVAVLLVVRPALVGSIGDGVVSLASTPFLLHTSGMLFVVNIDNKFSLFCKLGWQVSIPGKLVLNLIFKAVIYHADEVGVIPGELSHEDSSFSDVVGG